MIYLLIAAIALVAIIAYLKYDSWRVRRDLDWAEKEWERKWREHEASDGVAQEVGQKFPSVTALKYFLVAGLF